MTGPPERPGTPIDFLAGGIVVDADRILGGADDSDDVASRVLVALTAGEWHPAFTPRRTAPGQSLPRRTPGHYPGSHDPWRDQAQRPACIARDAASVASHTVGYFRGWNRGLETVRAGSSTQIAAAIDPIHLPTAPRAARRRPALRLATAVRLVGLVVKVLPILDRPRYAEELRAEMAALTGWQQLAYAVRLALSAPALRRSLRQERPGAPNSTE